MNGRMQAERAWLQGACPLAVDSGQALEQKMAYENIKNIVVDAAFNATAGDQVVLVENVSLAARCTQTKLGMCITTNHKG